MSNSNVNPLFKPFSHPKIELKNRIVMAPMTRNFSPDFVPGDQVADYYRRRAENEVGLIITEGTTIDHKSSNAYPGVPAFHGEEALAGWKKVVDEVHQAGAKIMPQLWHVGPFRKPNSQPNAGVPGMGPSGLLDNGKKKLHEMTEQDITEVIESFARAAADAKALGFDGVEFHGAHGYLIDNFFWERTNQRTDQYGGDIKRRSQFAADIVKASRDAVGPDFPLILRLSQWKQQDFDSRLAENPQELEELLTPLAEAGVDLFHCSTRRFWIPEFEGSDLNFAGWTKKITGLPTISVGSVGLNREFVGKDTNYFMNDADIESNLDQLVERMEKEEFDLIAVGRALISDPEWVLKVKRGDFDSIIPYTKESLGKLY